MVVFVMVVVLVFFVVGVVVVAVVVTVIHVDLRSSESPQARLLKALGIAENRESAMPSRSVDGVKIEV